MTKKTECRHNVNISKNIELELSKYITRLEVNTITLSSHLVLFKKTIMYNLCNLPSESTIQRELTDFCIHITVFEYNNKFGLYQM